MATIRTASTLHAYDLTSAPTAAPAIACIHGWLLSRSYWRPLLERLAPDYRCLTYDLRGFGDSPDDPAAGHSLADYAADLAHLLQALELERVWLLGHSLGGSIALWAARLYPEQVAGVICLNAGGGIYLKSEFDRFRRFGQQLVRRRPSWLPYVPFVDLVFARVMVARPLARQWGRQRALDFVRADERAALGALLASTTEAEVHRLPEVVSQLRQPVYFIAGERDRIMEPQYVWHLASFHELFGDDGDNTILLSDCGHMAMVEHPEAIAAHVRHLLARH